MIMRKINLLLLLFFFNIAGALAQTHLISGKVIDTEGAPVAFASIVVSGGNTGVNADANGVYSIRLREGTVILISATGYKSVSVTVTAQQLLLPHLKKAERI